MENRKFKLSWEDIGSLDPISSTKTALHILFRANIYDCLFKRNNNGIIEPQLCSHFKYLEDNILEINLRNDIKFHDNNIFNTKSIEYTFSSLKDSNMKFLYDSIENINIISEYKFHILLNNIDASLIPNLTLLPMLSPYKNNIPIGTGPYKYIDYKNGDFLKLHSNDKYWGKLPYFTEIEYICSNDPYNRYDKLLSGEVDLIFQPPHENIKKLKNDYVLNELNGPDTIVMSINCNREYFNQNVRNAISYCIDREELINTVFLNHAILPKSILSPPVFGYGNNLDDVKYDLKKAKSFIDLTEYKNGFKCSLILPKGAIPKLSETANIIKNSLSKINISVNILDYPEKKAWPLMGEGKYDMFINGWSEITLDPDYNLKSNFLRNNRENLDNEILFDLINKAKNITVDEKRKLEYQKIQQNIMELQSRIPIYHAKDVWVFKKDIDFTPRQDRLIDLKDTRAV